MRGPSGPEILVLINKTLSANKEVYSCTQYSFIQPCLKQKPVLTIIFGCCPGVLCVLTQLTGGNVVFQSFSASLSQADATAMSHDAQKIM